MLQPYNGDECSAASSGAVQESRLRAFRVVPLLIDLELSKHAWIWSMTVVDWRHNLLNMSMSGSTAETTTDCRSIKDVVVPGRCPLSSRNRPCFTSQFPSRGSFNIAIGHGNSQLATRNATRSKCCVRIWLLTINQSFRRSSG